MLGDGFANGRGDLLPPPALRDRVPRTVAPPLPPVLPLPPAPPLSSYDDHNSYADLFGQDLIPFRSVLY